MNIAPRPFTAFQGVVLWTFPNQSGFPLGISANLLYGFERFNLQNEDNRFGGGDVLDQYFYSS
jgi:hypothetical protein